MNNRKTKNTTFNHNEYIHKNLYLSLEVVNLYKASKPIVKLIHKLMDQISEDNVPLTTKNTLTELQEKLLTFKSHVVIDSEIYMNKQFKDIKSAIYTCDALLSRGIIFIYNYIFNYAALLNAEIALGKTSPERAKEVLWSRYDRFTWKIIYLNIDINCLMNRVENERKKLKDRLKNVNQKKDNT